MNKALGFQTKLTIATIGVVLVTVLCLSVSQMYMASRDALRQGRDGLGRISATLAESVALQHALMQRKILIDRDIMKTQFELSGFPVPEVLLDAELELVDQNGGEPSLTVMPAMKHGSVYLHEDNSVVRKVAELTGGVASILQLHEGRLVRISTSLEAPADFWGQGSFMDTGTPALAAVLQGKTWEGLVRLGGAWRMVRAIYGPWRRQNSGRPGNHAPPHQPGFRPFRAVGGRRRTRRNPGLRRQRPRGHQSSRRSGGIGGHPVGRRRGRAAGSGNERRQSPRSGPAYLRTLGADLRHLGRHRGSHVRGQ